MLPHHVSWLLWAVLLFFFGLRIRRIYDRLSMGRGRTGLGWLALVIFLSCFCSSPFSIAGLTTRSR